MNENLKLFFNRKRRFKLRAEGDIFFIETILEIYGNINLKWENWCEKHQSYGCHLENGEVYGFDDLEGVDDE